MPEFEVIPYSLDTFVDLVARKAAFSAKSYKLGIRGLYFEEYFKELAPKTIVVENTYIDQHYLDDYAGYYVHCFHDYGKECVRLHFFSHQFDAAHFSAILKGDKADSDFGKYYLGFVVVKPLPHTVIGRTCLKTYEENPRHYPITRDYLANLFGISLTVKSLAFQEQDKAAAACASSALWSIFQKTGHLFHHEIPSPFEITAAATQVFPPLIEFVENLEIQTRSLPSRGLSLFEMARAVRSVGLEPYVVQAQKKFILTSTAYAYLRAGIPLLLMIDVCKPGAGSVGKHAVALVGYRLNEVLSIDAEVDFACRSNRMEQLYVHDDQVGPFARMRWNSAENILSTSYGGPGTYVAKPETLLIPLSKNIRIPFGTISDLVRELDGFMEQARLCGSCIEVESDRIEWDIYLSSVQDFKAEVFKSTKLDENEKLRILTKSFPLYVWRVTAYDGDRAVLELVFDSTDLEQGKLLLATIPYDENFLETFRTAARSILSFAADTLSPRLLDTIRSFRLKMNAKNR
jgi:hypothetical protein